MLDDDHEMISLGLLEHHAVAQPPRADRGAAGAPRSAAWPASSAAPERAIVNVHVPPFGSGPRRGAGARREPARSRPSLGQVKFAPVGSTAVRDFLLDGPAAARPARAHPRVGRHPPARPDDRHQPGQRLLDRRAQRRADHPRAGQGGGPPAGPGLSWIARPGGDATAADVLVAIDVGTSGARAVAFDLDGRRLLEARRALPDAPRREPGWAEQDAPRLAIGRARRRSARLVRARSAAGAPASGRSA